jgi:motility quorum-sensing regulator/GCU-specific mRNA interferase toxin
MEKRKPTHDLEAFKRVCGDAATIRMAEVARNSARKLGFGRREVAAIVRTMKRSMFVKSMTSYADHRSWQDVYHVPFDRDLMIYLKFTDDLLAEFLILSFKER